MPQAGFFPRALLACGTCFVGCATPVYLDPEDAGIEPSREAAAVEDAADSVAPGDDRVLPDAGTEPPPATLDAGEDAVTTVAVAPELDDWKRALLGNYAVKTVAFSTDAERVISRNMTVTLSRIGQLADGTVEFSSQMCHWLAENPLTTMKLDRPDKLPETHQTVQFEDIDGERRWSTEPQVVTAGYDEEVPANCSGRVGGEYVPRSQEQIWIDDTCRCPESADAPPMLVSDCRITDPDQDQNPALTFTITSIVGSASKVFAASYDRSYLVFGNIASDGAHSARLAMEFRGYQLGCSGLSCFDFSTASTLAVPCPSDRSKVQFAPLDRRATPAGGWSCAAVVEQLAQLFPLPDPEVPNRCM